MERIRLIWNDIENDTRVLATQLRTDNIVGPDTKGFIALARGGLTVAQLLGYYLDMRRIETMTVVGYEDAAKATPEKLTQRILGAPSPDIGTGAGWVVVDDLVDTGGSFRFLKPLLPEARFVALYAKPEGAPQALVTVKTFAQDTWLDFPWEVNPI